MKEGLAIPAVFMVPIFVGILSTTTAFGNLFEDASGSNPDASNNGLFFNTPDSVPNINNNNGNLFYNTPSNTPDASNSDIEVNNNQSVSQKGDVNIGAQNCAEININSQNTAGDEGLDCHNIQDQSPENPNTAE
jgi:hypothetical protein